MGIEDAKTDLLEAYKVSMETDVVPQELIDAAERWMELADNLDALLDGEELPTFEQGGLGAG